MALFVLIQEHCYTGQSSRIFSKRKANLSAQLTCDLGVNDSALVYTGLFQRGDLSCECAAVYLDCSCIKDLESKQNIIHSSYNSRVSCFF